MNNAAAHIAMNEIKTVVDTITYIRETEEELLTIIAEADAVIGSSTSRVVTMSRRQVMELGIKRDCERTLGVVNRQYLNALAGADEVSPTVGMFAWHFYSSLHNGEMEYYGA